MRKRVMLPRKDTVHTSEGSPSSREDALQRRNMSLPWGDASLTTETWRRQSVSTRRQRKSMRCQMGTRLFEEEKTLRQGQMTLGRKRRPKRRDPAHRSGRVRDSGPVALRQRSKRWARSPWLVTRGGPHLGAALPAVASRLAQTVSISPVVVSVTTRCTASAARFATAALAHGELRVAQVSGGLCEASAVSSS